MVLTASTMLELGTPAPNFQLPDVVSGQTISLETFVGSKVLLVMFICQHCPFVKHVQLELAKISHDYDSTAIGMVAISSNDIQSHPLDDPEHLLAMATSMGFNFPVCFDETQAVAQRYTAACTPDFFVFDAERKLVYRGQLDDSRPSNDLMVTGRDLRAALEATLADQPITINQRPSIGCNIKWRPGNEPPYFG